MLTIRTRALAGSFVAAGIIALLAGCGSANPSATLSQPVPVPMATGKPVAATIFIADNGLGTVYLYSYATHKQLEHISGFSGLITACTDAQQDVYMVDFQAHKIDEYSHGGTLVQTLTDADGYPYSCAVDPVTGNLAVANYRNSSDELPGNLVIYPGATGTPAEYSVLNMAQPFYVTYDANGNLFINGNQSGYGSPIVAEMPAGATWFKDLRMDRNFTRVGGIQWDGSYLAICDTDVKPNVIYRFSIVSGVLTTKGTTALKGSTNVRQFFIAKIGSAEYLFANSGVSSHDAGKVSEWQYPAGGAAVFSIGNFYNPTGVAVSQVP